MISVRLGHSAQPLGRKRSDHGWKHLPCEDLAVVMACWMMQSQDRQPLISFRIALAPSPKFNDLPRHTYWCDLPSSMSHCRSKYLNLSRRLFVSMANCFPPFQFCVFVPAWKPLIFSLRAGPALSLRTNKQSDFRCINVSSWAPGGGRGSDSMPGSFGWPPITHQFVVVFQRSRRAGSPPGQNPLKTSRNPE